MLTRNDFILACDAAMNPALEIIERASVEIVQCVGLLCEANSKRFAAFNDITAHVFPTAEVPRAIACAEWNNWLFFFDDVHDEEFEKCEDIGKVACGMEDYLTLLRTGESRADLTPLARLLIDFRERVFGLASPAWLSRFCESFEDYLFRGVLPAVDNWISGRTLRLDDYLVQREFDSAVYTLIDLVELAEGVDLTGPVRGADAMRRIRRAGNYAIGFFNDIVSYPKEVLKNKNPNNLIHVIMSDHRCSYEEAVVEAVAIVNGAMLTIFELEDKVTGLDRSLAPALQRYVMGIKNWQRGNVEWSLTGDRYRSEHSPFHELRKGRRVVRAPEPPLRLLQSM